jgi:hypothetical protein
VGFSDRLSLWLLRKQRIHNLGAAPKICGFQPPKNRSQINQSAPRSEVEHPKSACYRQTSVMCDGDPGAVINENEFGANGNSKRDCGTLALVQSGCCSVVGIRIGIRSYLKPSRTVCDPCPHRRWRIDMRKFALGAKIISNSFGSTSIASIRIR